MEIMEVQENDIKPNIEKIKLSIPEQLPNFLRASRKKSSTKSDSQQAKKDKQNCTTESPNATASDNYISHGICSNCNNDFRSPDDICLEIAGDVANETVSNSKALAYVYESKGKENYALVGYIDGQSVFVRNENSQLAMCRKCSSSLTKLYKAFKQFSELCHLQSTIAQKLAELETLQASIYQHSLKVKPSDKTKDFIEDSYDVKVEPIDVFYENNDKDGFLHMGYNVDDSDYMQDSDEDYGWQKKELRPKNHRRPKRNITKANYFDYGDTISNIDSEEDDNAISDSKDEEFKPSQTIVGKKFEGTVFHNDTTISDEHEEEGNNTVEEIYNSNYHSSDSDSSKGSNEVNSSGSRRTKMATGGEKISKARKQDKFKAGEPDTCSHCSKVFQNPRSLQRHMKIHTDQDNDKLTCSLCMKKFTQRNHMVRHMRTVHKTSSLHLTTDSKKEKEANDDKSSENQEKSNKKVFQCTFCEKSFLRRDSLSEHILRHTTDAPFSCEICSKTFLQKRGLIRHKMLHNDENPFCCELCDQSFTRSDHLKRHMEAHKAGRVKSSESDQPVKEIECEVCGKHYKHRFQLKMHKLTHTNEKPWSCDICESCFNHPSALRAHKKVHSDERKYCCNVCGKSYKRKNHLQEHEALHLENISKPYKCIVENCGRDFRRKRDLNDHTTAAHTKEKDFVCELCGAAFTRNRNLRAHQVIHSGEKSFVCELCPAAFNRRDNLRVHVRAVHLNDPTAKRSKGPSKQNMPEQNGLPHQMSCDFLMGLGV